MTARRALVVADDLGYDPAIDAGHPRGPPRRGGDGGERARRRAVRGGGAGRGAPRRSRSGCTSTCPPDSTAAEAEAEIRRQLRRFEAIRGAPPVHVDGHRHVHAEPAVLEALLRVAGPLRLRVRALDPAMRDRIRAAGALACDDFLGDAGLRPCWTPERLAAGGRRAPAAGRPRS